MNSKLKIVFLEKLPLFSNGLIAILEKADILVTDKATNWEELYVILKNSSPDALLIDLLNYPDGATDSLQLLRDSYPEIPVLIITDESFSDYFRDYIILGVNGMIFSNMAGSELIMAVNKIAHRQEHFPAEVMHVLRESLVSNPVSPDVLHHLHRLTAREADVLKLFCRGLSYKEIGKILSISHRTVETHKKNILAKLKIKSTAEMISYAMLHKLV